MAELKQELSVAPMPPTVIGGALVIPQELLDRLQDKTVTTIEVSQTERERIDKTRSGCRYGGRTRTWTRTERDVT